MSSRRAFMLASLAGLATPALAFPALAATPASVVLPTLPPIIEPASGEHHPGKMIFAELICPDLARAKAFYAGLFGWTYRDIQAGDTRYAQALLDGHTVAGMVEKKPADRQPRQPFWLSFFAAADVDATTAIALKAGAKTLFMPQSIPGRGREAVLTDPQGAVFALLASLAGDPPDMLSPPGAWIWSDLITTDPDTAAAFYQGLFDYEVYELPTNVDTEHLLLASDDYARASVTALPQPHPKAHPHWLNFIRVDDATATVAKALALGGQTLVTPRRDRHGGLVAVIADPSGAPFGLLEWTVNDSKLVSP